MFKVIEICVLIVVMVVLIFGGIVSVLSSSFYYNNSGFIFLFTVSLLCSFLFSAPNTASCIFFGFSLLDIKCLSYSCQILVWNDHHNLWTCNTLLHALLAFKVSTEKPAVTLESFPLYVTYIFFLLQLLIHFLCSVYLTQCMPIYQICQCELTFLVLSIWCSMCCLYLYGFIFPYFGEKFFMILFMIWSLRLTWNL